MNAGRSTVCLLALALLLVAGAPGALAQEDDAPANEGALFLLLPVDPKAVGLGRAVTALPGPESVWWNPAGLGEVDENRFSAFRGEGLAGDATAASLLFSFEGVGTLGLSYQLLDAGSTDLTDEQGNVLGTFTFREHLGVLSLASQMGDHLSLGVNVKLVQDRFSCRGQCVDGGETGTTFAVDAGVQAMEIAGLPIRLGAVLAHAGPDLQIVNEAQADPLPTRIRAAVAYEALDFFVPSDELDVWVTVEVDDRWRDPGNPATYVGAEFEGGRGDQRLSLRAGYVFNGEAQVDGAAVGLGLRYERFEVGIAKSLATQTLTGETEPVHVSLGYVF